jgi:hypothetical protein
VQHRHEKKLTKFTTFSVIKKQETLKTTTPTTTSTNKQTFLFFFGSPSGAASSSSDDMIFCKRPDCDTNVLDKSAELKYKE